MTLYELVVLFHPDLEIDLEGPLKKVERQVTDAGGKVVKTDTWGKRKLAYPIRGAEFAVYVYWEIELPADGVAKLDRTLNITDESLRHLLTKHVEIPELEEAETTAAEVLKEDKE